LNNYYILINLILSISIFILGLLLWTFPIPTNKFLENYKFSSKLLSISYITLAILNMLMLIFDPRANSTEFFPFYVTLAASIQSLIFMVSFLSLIDFNKRSMSYSFLKIHVALIILWSIGYFFSQFLCEEPNLGSLSALYKNLLNPIALIRVSFFGFYIFQISYYTFLFTKVYQKYRQAMDNYYSESRRVKLPWLRNAFISALAIGLFAIIQQTYSTLWTDAFLSTLIVPFYVLFAIYFINYHKIYNIIKPAIVEESDLKIESEKTAKKSSWSLYKEKILVEKLFLKESVTLVEVAQILNVSRTTLSTFINTEEHKNFNQWINQLRIEEAKTIMMEHPDYSISYISATTGFSESSNFSREFKQHTGTTATSWKTENSISI